MTLEEADLRRHAADGGDSQVRERHRELELGRALAGLGEKAAAREAFVAAERLFAADGSERQRKIAEELRNQLDKEQE